MKTWPPLPHAADAPPLPPRIPAFHPVPVGARKDGWAPRRQAAFVGFLAETRSVEGACRKVGMGKHSAYRLRLRPGAAGFAAAWDAALGKLRPGVDLACAKSTGLDAAYRRRMGLLLVVMERGRYAGCHWIDDENAPLPPVAPLARGSGGEAAAEQRLRRLSVSHVSGPGVDFAPQPAAQPVSPAAWPGPGAPRAEPAVPEWRSSPEMRALVARMVES